MLDNTLHLLTEGEFEWGPEDTVPSLRADIVQLRTENRRLKEELSRLHAAYDDLAKFATRVAGSAAPPPRH